MASPNGPNAWTELRSPSRAGPGLMRISRSSSASGSRRRNSSRVSWWRASEPAPSIRAASARSCAPPRLDLHQEKIREVEHRKPLEIPSRRPESVGDPRLWRLEDIHQYPRRGAPGHSPDGEFLGRQEAGGPKARPNLLPVLSRHQDGEVLGGAFGHVGPGGHGPPDGPRNPSQRRGEVRPPGRRGALFQERSGTSRPRTGPPPGHLEEEPSAGRHSHFHGSSRVVREWEYHQSKRVLGYDAGDEPDPGHPLAFQLGEDAGRRAIPSGWARARCFTERSSTLVVWISGSGLGLAFPSAILEPATCWTFTNHRGAPSRKKREAAEKHGVGR